MRGALPALHTWNGRLETFLHIYAIMAGGAYDAAQDRWIPSRHPDFLFPIGMLSALVRGKFLAGLKGLYAHKLLKLDAPGVHHQKRSATWGSFLDQLYHTDCYTYVEKAVAGPDLLFEYLGQYLQRAGI